MNKGSPHLAMHLLDLGDAAKVAQRGVARVGGDIPAGNIVGRRFRQMRLDLVVEIAIACSCRLLGILKKRAMMPVERCHRASSRASCFRRSW
jgi:hypothetical protein